MFGDTLMDTESEAVGMCHNVNISVLVHMLTVSRKFIIHIEIS